MWPGFGGVHAYSCMPAGVFPSGPERPSPERDQTLADCVSVKWQFPQAHAELATLPQGQRGTQGAGRALTLHYLQSHGRTE
jgi:hypothetical protein